MKIELEIAGQKLEPEMVVDKDERDIYFNIINYLRDSLGTVCCKQHRQTPQVVIKGKSLDALELDISGCCDSLVEHAERKLA